MGRKRDLRSITALLTDRIQVTLTKAFILTLQKSWFDRMEYYEQNTDIKCSRNSFRNVKLFGITRSKCRWPIFFIADSDCRFNEFSFYLSLDIGFSCRFWNNGSGPEFAVWPLLNYIFKMLMTWRFFSRIMFIYQQEVRDKEISMCFSWNFISGELP